MVDDRLGEIRGRKIGVLMGGLSGERDVSLISGRRVLESLIGRGFTAVGIDADRTVARRLEEEGVEVACIMLHGRFGEDGTIQGLLEQMGIPYTGSGVLASALAMDKVASKRLFRADGIPTPDFIEVPRDADVAASTARVRERIGFPAVVKPVAQGSSLGVVIADDEAEAAAAIRENRRRYGDLLAERFIEGTAVTVGILGIGRETRPLPILELRPRNAFYDYEAKYTPGMTEFVCPAELDEQAGGLTRRYALAAHRCLGCHGFSRVDLQVDGDGNPWVLEVNTIPGMTKLSDLPAEAEAAGIPYDDLVEEILRSAHLDAAAGAGPAGSG
jgi:D-alanine-D-alanine ligase